VTGIKAAGLWKRSRIFSAVLVVIALTAGFLILGAAAEGSSTIPAPKQIMLSWTGDPTSTQTLTWNDNPDLTEVVEYIDKTDYTTAFSGALQAAAMSLQVSTTTTGYWRYEATVSGLSPSTVYYYRIGNSAGWSTAGTFTTAPPKSTENFLFSYFGDIQTTNETEMQAWGTLLQNAYSAYGQMAFGLQGGDIVESGLDLDGWQAFLNQATTVFSKIPFMSCNGNHESNFAGVGKPVSYLQMFALPTNGPDGFKEEFYSFNYGNCHYTVLNANVFSGEENLTDSDFTALADWIRNDLQSSRATWNIVMLHQPALPLAADSVCSAVKANWVPIFESTGVDLVIEGHQHVYSRSYPMYGGKIDYTNGITYLMGVSGSKFYSTADETYAAKTIYNTSNYEIFEVDGSHMYVSSYDKNGNLLDYNTLTAKAKSYSAVTGDVNNDGIVNMDDVNAVEQAIKNSADYSQVMDINSDGTVDIRDAQKILITYLALC